jgi:hypothetical protein
MREIDDVTGVSPREGSGEEATPNFGLFCASKSSSYYWIEQILSVFLGFITA